MQQPPSQPNWQQYPQQPNAYSPSPSSPQWQAPYPSQPMYTGQLPLQSPPFQPPMPPAPAPKKSRTWIWIVALIVVFFFGNAVGRASVASDTTATTSNTSATAQPTQAPTATPVPAKPTAAPKWVVVQKFTGSGSKKTGTFTVGDNWGIQWACAPNSSAIGSYNVIVDVYNSDGTPAAPGAINTICKPGNTSDVTQEHQGGNIYLDIQSEGDWAVVIQELK